VTTSERELTKFVRGQRYREREYHKKMQEELRGVPSSRYTENIKAGLKIQEPKQIQRTIEEYSGYEVPRRQTIPHMVVPMWGSITQRKERLPVFGGTPTKTRKQPVKIKKTVIDHNEFLELLNQGYSREELENQGIVDRYSRHYQEESVFGRGVVPYKPLSYYQVTLPKPTLPKTPFEQRIERGERWEGFYPPRIEFKKAEFKRITW
jgi:hypothetical protein